MKNRIKNCVRGAVLAASLMATQSAFAGLSMVAKIGDIKGESVVIKHEGEIDVLSYSWGVVQPNAKVGAPSASKGVVNALTLTKYVDTSSPTLFIDAAQGKVMPQAQFVVMKAGGKAGPVEFIKIKLTDAMVASVSNGERETVSGQLTDRFIEKITLVFSAAEYSTSSMKADGTAANVVTVRWSAAGKT